MCGLSSWLKPIFTQTVGIADITTATSGGSELFSSKWTFQQRTRILVYNGQFQLFCCQFMHFLVDIYKNLQESCMTKAENDTGADNSIPTTQTSLTLIWLQSGGVIRSRCQIVRSLTRQFAGQVQTRRLKTRLLVDPHLIFAWLGSSLCSGSNEGGSF